MKDVRYGLRQLRRNPGFAAVAVLTLALGIGANTAIFSVVNSVLLSPLRYLDADRLVALYSRTAEFPRYSISYPDFLDWVRDNRSFSALAAFLEDDFDLTGRGEPERVSAEMVSASFFALLGVRPVIGRNFRAEEDQVGGAPVVMISGGLWKQRFGSSPDVLGRVLTLNGVAYSIVGVVPADFYYGGPNFHRNGRAEVYIPIGQWNDSTFHDRRAAMGMDAVGRLKPRITLEQAKADMAALARHLAEQYPEADKDHGITLLPLKQMVVGRIQPFLLVLLAAVAFVLLIACVNVANLMLARSTARTREFAIRTALGASRSGVIRQLLTESILLALAGGGLGLLTASWGLHAALKALPEALPRAQEVHLDWHVLFFTLGASVLAGVLFGLAPAINASEADLHAALKEGGRGLSGKGHRAQRVFVVAEMALALVLLAGAGLMIRSLAKLWSVNPGFDPHHVLTFGISFPTMEANPDSIRATLREIHDSLIAIPGVQAASITAGAQPMLSDSEWLFWLEGQPKPLSQSQMKTALFYSVQPDFFKTMQIPLERGRLLMPQDDEHSRLVTVIDDRFAALYFSGQDPIGKRINFNSMSTAAEIVGVVGHVKQWGLDENAGSPIQAQCYFAVSQTPDSFLRLLARGAAVVVRTEGSPLAHVGSIRHALEQVNSQQAMFDVETMDEIISYSLRARRFSMILLGIFAVLALVMSCAGIYGVISYLVGQRRHEIGIRMALGAKRQDVLRMILGEAAKMAFLGVAIGLVVSFALARLMAKLLFGVSAHDPITLAGVASLLVLIALMACYIPAHRATKVDPMVALRYE
jgi:predicted permease